MVVLVAVLLLFAQLNSFVPFNEAVEFNNYDDNWDKPAMHKIMTYISLVSLKKDCNKTDEETLWEMAEQDLENNDTKIELIIKGVHAKRFLDMGVTDCGQEETLETILKNFGDSVMWRPSVNVTKTDRIKIHNARLLSFKNAFNAAIIGDPIIFEANEDTTLTKNVTKIVNLEFGGFRDSRDGPSTGSYTIKRSYMFVRYLIDFEIDEDASITTKGHCSNIGSQTISLTKFLNKNPVIFSDLDFIQDNVRLENSNGTFILKNFPTKLEYETVNLLGYSCCWH